MPSSVTSETPSASSHRLGSRNATEMVPYPAGTVTPTMPLTVR